MTTNQLTQIKQFAFSFYQKADQFHDQRHAELTKNYAFLLAKDFPQTNLSLLEAACYLHDIGRINTEKGHAQESARLAKPFLKKIKITPHEEKQILHAVSVHGIELIHTAHTIEAKLLFDADKIQQVSVFGFLRMVSYMVVTHKMDLAEAMKNRMSHVQKIWGGFIQTETAKQLISPQIEKIQHLVSDFQNGQTEMLQ